MKKPLEKPLIPMVDMWKTIDIPSFQKMYHRRGLVQTHHLRDHDQDHDQRFESGGWGNILLPSGSRPCNQDASSPPCWWLETPSPYLLCHFILTPSSLHYHSFHQHHHRCHVFRRSHCHIFWHNHHDHFFTKLQNMAQMYNESHRTWPIWLFWLVWVKTIFHGEEKQSMAFGIPQMQICWGGNMKFTAFGFMQISLIELLWSALVMLVRWTENCCYHHHLRHTYLTLDV